MSFVLFTVFAGLGLALLIALAAGEMRRQQLRERFQAHARRNDEALEQVASTIAGLEAAPALSEPVSEGHDPGSAIPAVALNPESPPELLAEIESFARERPDGFSTVIQQLIRQDQPEPSADENELQTAT